ncbi:unnamed protein product [Didymodactylos carnosus]|uniref:Uncharacterized protein n=1 Tax=Didymodactylos carnosus TaxID=1234261 RepID=A0A8S2HB04_9BILA|nr:unnamed protein product [Didymodactylos carnosus]CAF3624268.1 unnamed protein product [Didymodactylos carnosus]
MSSLFIDEDDSERPQNDDLDKIKVIDGKGSQLSYESLPQSEKEKILADLLIQSALHNISEQNVIKNTTIPSDINLPDNDSVSQQLPHMFGKMQGTRWVRKPNKPLNPIALSKEQTMVIADDIQTENSGELTGDLMNTMNEIVTSKIFGPARLFVPTAISQDQLQIPLQLRSKPRGSSWRHDDSSVTSSSTLNDPGLLLKIHRSKIIPASKSQGKIDTMESTKHKLLCTGKTFASGRCVTSPLSDAGQTERLRIIGSPIQDDQESVVVDDYQSAVSNTDIEPEENFHPSEINIDTTEESRVPLTANDLIQMGHSAYTHRTHNSVKSKGSIPGALLIAPGGQVLKVGQSMQSDTDYGEYLNNPFPLQSQTIPEIRHNNAPGIPIAIGGKRDRLPDETVIRRTMDFKNGDFNSQIGIYTWSYEIPIQDRKAPEEYTFIPAPPPVGLSAFSGKKHHYVKRNVQHIPDSGQYNVTMLHSTLSMHSETPANHHLIQMPPKSTIESTAALPSRSLFSFTTWAYQRPATPPVVKHPYLYKPDHAPQGAKGKKHPALENETFIRRTLDVHGGDIDASLSFTIWVYDMWINDLIKRVDKIDLQDKDFLSALAEHAQALAKIILKRTDSGHHLVEDAQHAIIENLRNLKQLLDKTLKTVTINEYREILKDTLTHVLSRGNLSHLEINDELLMQLMDYPADAFEVYIDEQSGKEIIRLKSAFRTKKTKIKASKAGKKTTKTVIISEEISADDFEQVVDDITGETVFRLKKEVAERKGLKDLSGANFDIVIDKETGKKIVKMKTGIDGAKGSFIYLAHCVFFIIH